MKSFIFAALVGVAASAAALAPDNVAIADVEWQDMFPGVEFGPIYGDYMSEAHAKYVRFQPGTLAPMHHHSGGYDGVLIAGRMVNILDETTRVEVEPGDYFHMAADRSHGHECVSEEPCLFYTSSAEAWDIAIDE